MQTSNLSTVPAELRPNQEQPTAPPPQGGGVGYKSPLDAKICSYVLGWRNTLRTSRTRQRDIWDECWQLYRGQEDWKDKQEWQSRIVLPKAWSSVKQATNVIKRLLQANQRPWRIEATNPDDQVTVLRADQMSDLVQVFLDNANFIEHFAEGLECSFITGIGIWKEWWGINTRTVMRTENGFDPQTGVPTKSLVRSEIEEGKLMIRAVDPYNFYWLPGSKPNKWVGTLEEIEIAKWELLELAEKGLFDVEQIKALKPVALDSTRDQRQLRFDQTASATSQPDERTAPIKLTEYYGPIIIDDKMVERHGHIILAGEQVVLRNGPNAFWHRTPPYRALSPLSLPFRADGVGLIEMVRAIDKALNKIANLSVDTLTFRLMPTFEVFPEMFENGEDFETGLMPGKFFRRQGQMMQSPGILPVQMQDISGGTVQVAAVLDRAHQEGALVSEIQQALPRYRGVQTATETEAKQANQESFFGSLAADIESQGLKPLIEMALDLILQFLPTSSDPRVASILGVGAQRLAAISREELHEMVEGDYKVKVTGITEQINKAEMLTNLIQLMNIVGQNPEAWMPYINQSALLTRIVEGFRPFIRDIDNIVATEETVAANKQAMRQEQIVQEAVKMLPQFTQMAQQQQTQQQDMQMQQQQQVMDMTMQQQEMDMREREAQAAEAAARARPTGA